MRKLSWRRSQWLVKRDKRLHRKSIRQAFVPKPRQRRLKGDTLVAPSFFTLLLAQHEGGKKPALFLEFLQHIRQFKGTKLHIDLADVGRIVSVAALVFKAELCYLAARGVDLSGTPPRKPRSLQVLTQTGICELLHMEKAPAVDREDTVHWKHTSGEWLIAQPARLVNLAQPAIGLNSESLYNGMIEAIANSIEHAYKSHPARRSFSPKQDGWWGFQQLRNGELSTCICDLGIGVSRALPLKMATEPDLLRKLLHAHRSLKGADRRALLAAVEYGRSGTKQPERGKGLRDAQKVIDDAGEGAFHLISYSGMYFYQRKRGEKHADTGTRRLQGSIGGTISYWRFPVESRTVLDQLPQGVLS